MPDTYIDVPAQTNALRDALIANGGGSSGSWKVYRLADGTHQNNLEHNSIQSLQYVRITAATGASPIVQCTNESGLKLYYGQYWEITSSVEWRPYATGWCFTVERVQNIKISAKCTLSSNCAGVIYHAGGGATWAYGLEFDGIVIGANNGINGNVVIYGIGSSVYGDWDIHDATISGVTAVLKPHGGSSLTAYLRRCTLVNCRHAALMNYASGSTAECDNNLILSSVGDSSYGIFHAGEQVNFYGRLRVRGNTVVGGTGKAVLANFSGTIAEITVLGNIFCDITYGTDRLNKSGFTHANNVARNCTYNGGAGTNDITVTSPDVVGFVNESGGDYHLIWNGGRAWNHWTYGTCPLTTDKDGIARPQGQYPDAGCYEAVCNDCGVTGGELLDNRNAKIIFSPAEGGTAVPLKSSAENPQNWSCATNKPTNLYVDSVTQLSSTEYKVTFDRPVGSEIITVTALPTMESDQGGRCNNPTGSVQLEAASIDCGVTGGELLDPLNAKIIFEPDTGSSALPLQESAENPQNWSCATSKQELLFVDAVERISQTPTKAEYKVTFDRIVSDEIILVTALPTMESDQGGKCNVPVGWVQIIAPYIYCGIQSLEFYNGYNKVIATFSSMTEDPAKPLQEDAEDPTKWQIETNADGIWGNLVLVSSEKYDNNDYKYLLTFSRELINGERIIVNTGNIRTDRGGTCSFPETAELSVVSNKKLDYELSLPALLGATGNAIAKLIGKLSTRLTRELAITDTEIFVESTIGFPDNGYVAINGEQISYSRRTATSFLDCVRAENNIVFYPEGLSSWPIGTIVYSYNYDWNALEQAFNDTLYSLMPIELLNWSCIDLGIYKPFSQMSDDEHRLFIRNVFLNDKANFNSLFRILLIILKWAEKTGDDGTWKELQSRRGTYYFTSKKLYQQTNRDLHDSWIIIDNEYLCRIKSYKIIGEETYLLLEASDGPFWKGITQDSNIHTWRLLPFRIVQNFKYSVGRTFERAIASKITIYIYTRPSGVQYTYLVSGGLISDDRPKAGKLMSSTPGEYDPGPYEAGMENDPNSPNYGFLKAPLYLPGGIKTTLKITLDKFIAAGIYCNVIEMPE